MTATANRIERAWEHAREDDVIPRKQGAGPKIQARHIIERATSAEAEAVFERFIEIMGSQIPGDDAASRLVQLYEDAQQWVAGRGQRRAA